MVEEGAADCDALALASRKRVDPPCKERVDLEQRKDDLCRGASRARTVQHVVLHVEVGKQGDVLWHIADAPIVDR